MNSYKILSKLSTLLLAIAMMILSNAQAQTKCIPNTELATGSGVFFEGLMDNATSQITMTMTGPSDRWFAVGFGMDMLQGDVLMYGVGAANGPTSHALGAWDYNTSAQSSVGVVPDASQDWTIVSDDVSGLIRTVVATRDLNTGDGDDIALSFADVSVDVIWAKFSSASYVKNYHGAGNRGATTLTWGACLQDPIASFTNSISTANCGESISFDGSGSSALGGAAIVSYEWDYENDGTIDATGINGNYSYNATGSYTVALTVTDNQGGTNTTTSVVTIVDTQAPSTPTLSVLSGDCGYTAPSPTTTDNCAGTVTGTTTDATTFSGTGSFVINWTFDDGNGNTIIVPQNVNISDATDPTIPALSNVTGECSATAIAPTTTDNCAGTITGTTTDPLTYNTQGSHTILWTFDDGNGNSIIVPQVVVINDVTNPTITCPSDQIETPDANCEFTLPDYTGLVSGVDNCATPVSITQSPAASTVIAGNTPITLTANDGNGNTSSCTFDVILVDVVEPTAICQNATVYLGVNGDVSLPATEIDNGSTDNCLGLAFSLSQSVFTCNEIGSNVITMTASDGSNNTSTCNATITVLDTISPTLPAITDLNSECSITPTPPVAVDNCSGNITGIADVTFPISALGTTLVTWTYTDDEGNTSSQTQNVIISAMDVSTTTNLGLDLTQTISANANGYAYQWIEDCGVTDSEIIGATNIDFMVPSNGSYAVILSLGSCSDTSDCIIVDNLGIDNSVENLYLNVYPNPTTGKVSVELGRMYENVTVSVLDAIGQIVLKKKYTSTEQLFFDLNESPGLYIINVKTSEGFTARTYLVKEK
jgi:PKD repeat protein